MNAKVLIFSLMVVFSTSCKSKQVEKADEVKIQKLEKFTLDGTFEEWENIPYRKLYADPLGNHPEKNDLTAGFKIAWMEDYLLLYFEILDDISVSDTINPWDGDAVEFFLMDSKGSDNSVQFSLVTGIDNTEKPVVNIQDRRELKEESWKEPELMAKIDNEDKLVKLEIMLRYDIFGQDYSYEKLALQLYVDDSDNKPGGQRNQLTWYPVGHSYVNPFSSYEILLTENENTVFQGASRLVITDNEKIDLIVFGAKEGDRVEVKTTGGESFQYSSSSMDLMTPDTFEIDNSTIDLESDTLLTYIGNDLTSMNDLFFAPRVYDKINAKRLEREIKVFIAKDRLHLPEPGGVLFIGSSSIRKWNSIKQDFPELNTIHRGFGGSNSADALEYMDKIVLPYKPSVVVYYEGDNDIPGGLSYDEIISKMRTFIERVLKADNGTKIYLISPKPSYRRINLWDQYLKLHQRMKILANEFPQVSFVDVSLGMFTDGKLRKDIFIEDNLHMNEKGYEIWTRILRDTMNLQ